ncbi:MAG: NTP transferase domain-containing protein [Nanoarchaeota archaeon]|nr:NTP transferase domain-containing protein [Nanoarchaeota archaeon]
MNTKYNPNFAENSIDAVVLAGKSELTVQDNLNITYPYFPIYNSYIPSLYHIENMNPPKPIDKAGIDYKAIIKIDGKPMVNYVMEALAESGYINNIYVVGEEDQLNKADIPRGKEKIKFVDDQGSFVDNLIEGGNKTKSKKILYSTSDIPLITSKDIDNFIEECSYRRDGHFYLAYYLKEDYEKNFSGVKSGKFYQLDDKFVKNGYIFMLDRDFLDDINKNKAMRNTIAFLYSGRKKGLWPYLKLIHRYLSFASLSLLIKYKRRTLTIDEAEKILSGIIKHNIVAIKSSSQVGIDVDSYEELQNIEKIIKKQ